MPQLNLPVYDIKIKEENGQRKIFDILRRKYLVITPEEWVRQHFIHYLIEHKNYPMGLLANEISLSIGEKSYPCRQCFIRQVFASTNDY